ncbi:MAG: hypothetical protein ACREIA_14675 [Opitutaceae bacterium]
MSEQSKPTAEEVKRLLTKEALARIALQAARARAHLALAEKEPKATYHQCRARAVAATVPEYRRYEKARVELLTVGYIINGTLDIGNEHTFGVT